MSRTGNSRLLQLDLLRVVAVFLVMGRHLWAGPWQLPAWLEPVVATWQRGGWAGVDLFFVLSGFLVAGLLFQDQQRHGEFGITRFYIRRGFKIYPAFFVFLAVGLLARLVTGDTPTVRRVLPELLFLQNYFTCTFDHTWSLAVEEHFYLALPLFLLLVQRAFGSKDDPYRLLLPAIGMLALVACGLRIEQFVNHDYHHRSHLQPTHLRFDGLLIGVALAYLYHCRRGWLDQIVAPRPQLFVLVGIATYIWPLLILPDTQLWLYSAGLTLLSLGGASLIIGLLYLRLPEWSALRWLGWVGSHSYSIYLWHMLVLSGVVRLNRATDGTMPFVVLCTLYVGGSVLLGSGMATLIEFPVLRLRDRWFPPRTQPSTTPRPTPVLPQPLAA